MVIFQHSIKLAHRLACLNASTSPVPVRLGPQGIAKQIFLRARESDVGIDYLKAFIELARMPVAGQAR